MTNTVLRRLLVAAAALGVAGSLAACSAKPAESECAIVVGKGVGDGQTVKKIARPGESVAKGDDEDWYLPCGPRNYVVTADQNHGDRHNPVLAMTGPAEKDTDGVGSPVKLWLSAYFTPNETDAGMGDLWRLCFKYSCALGSGDDEHDANWSAGWLSLLNENFGPAIDRAAGVAMRKFDPDVWSDPAKRPKVAEAISAEFATQVKAATGYVHDIFCASGPEWDAKAKSFDCRPVRFTVENIEPTSAEVIKQYDQRVGLDAQQRSAEAQKTLNGTKLDAAKAAYGPWAEYYLGLFEAIDRCKAAGATCVINVGGAGSPPPAIPVPAR